MNSAEKLIAHSEGGSLKSPDPSSPLDLPAPQCRTGSGDFLAITQLDFGEASRSGGLKKTNSLGSW